MKIQKDHPCYEHEATPATNISRRGITPSIQNLCLHRLTKYIILCHYLSRCRALLTKTNELQCFFRRLTELQRSRYMDSQTSLDLASSCIAGTMMHMWRFGALYKLASHRFMAKSIANREHAKKFKAEDTQVDITGKNCIVTGANSGIGFATAEALASRGANVYLVCRNKGKGEEALSEIKSKTGNLNVHLEICDLSSLKEIKAFTSSFTSRNQPLHVLVNNAGLLEHNHVTTIEGLELNFAVNVTSVYTITELLLPSLEKAAPDARVITVSSGGMYTAPLTSDLQFIEGKFDGTTQYARNKRLQVALTERWAEVYGDKGIGFYSMHPGWSDTPGVAKSLPGFSNALAGKLRTPEEGADTIVWLALQPKDKLKSGSFYFDRAEAPKHLPLCGTHYSANQVTTIIGNLRSLSGMSEL